MAFFAQIIGMKHLIAPSLLAADFGNLQRDVELINGSQADWFHLDVMDGVFVPNISFGTPVIEAIRMSAKLPLDIHLMIVDPDRYLGLFRDLGAHVITVHFEACTHLHRTLQAIHAMGLKAGVALNPHTTVNVLEDVLEDIDLVCIMSVNPGFGGQKFIPRTYDKVRQLAAMKSGRNENLLIEIDGGVGEGNAKALVEAGANVLVAGNSVFASTDPTVAIARLKNIQ